ncbi:MAG: hypothetical protein JXA09_09000 [Anaerolineae bacterium]|nr:hypothetical protein [Anaerolineae bacterium]
MARTSDEIMDKLGSQSFQAMLTEQPTEALQEVQGLLDRLSQEQRYRIMLTIVITLGTILALVIVGGVVVSVVVDEASAGWLASLGTGALGGLIGLLGGAKVNE